MDFEPSTRASDYLARMQDFMDEAVYPAEPVYAQQRRDLAAQGRTHTLPDVVEELKADARSRGLWNLFLPDAHDPAHGLSVLEYAPIAELSGRSVEIAPEAINCSAPDTGNMELLHMFGFELLPQMADVRPLLDRLLTAPKPATGQARQRVRRDG